MASSVHTLCEFTDELHFEYGFDVEEEMRCILPQEDIDGMIDMFEDLFDGPGRNDKGDPDPEDHGRPETPDDHQGSEEESPARPEPGKFRIKVLIDLQIPIGPEMQKKIGEFVANLGWFSPCERLFPGGS